MADRVHSESSDFKSENSKKQTKKPMMEKLRRERINRNLNEMKTLVLEALHRDSSRYSKMEKADILEMTVKYLKQIHFEMRTRKDASSPADFRLVSGTHRAADARVRVAMSTNQTQQRTRFNPQYVQNFHDNSHQEPQPIAPTAHSSAPLLPVSSVAMATRSNRTVRWVPYPSPPSSPTRSKMATSCARLQTVHTPIVASPRVNNPSEIPISGVSYPTERLLWRGW